MRTSSWWTRRRLSQRLSLARCKANAIVVDYAVVALVRRWGRTMVDAAAEANGGARAYRWDALVAAMLWGERLSLAL